MNNKTPYNLSEGALNSAISFVGKQINKQVKARGAIKVGQLKKAEAAADKAAKKAAAKKSAAAVKGAATRKENAAKKVEENAPKPGRMSGSKGIDARPSGFPTIKPVVLNRTQHFESAVGNSKDTPAKPAPRPSLNTEQASFYND